MKKVILLFMFLKISLFSQQIYWVETLPSCKYYTSYNSIPYALIWSSPVSLHYSNDTGKTWESHPIEYDVDKVFFDGDLLYGYKDRNKIVKSTNMGENWIDISFNNGKPNFMSVDNNGTIWVSSNQKKLYYSTDQGSTFNSLAQTFDTLISSVYVDSNYLIVCSKPSGYYLSTNHGSTFSKVINESGGVVKKKSTGELIVPVNYKIYNSTNNDISWIYKGMPFLIEELFIKGDELYTQSASFSYGYHRIFKSIDKGDTWQMVGVDDLSDNLFRIDFFSTSTIVASKNGIFLYDEQNPLLNDTIKFELPFVKGNKFQYIYETWSDRGGSIQLKEDVLDKDTTIDGKTYIYHFETLWGKHLTRYDYDSNRIYIYSSGEKQLIDFGTPNNQYYNFFNVYDNTWQRKKMLKYNALILGDSVLTMRLEGSTLGAFPEYFLYSKGIGLVYNMQAFDGPGGTYSGRSNTLISAIIYDSLGNYKYYADSTLCSIQNLLVNINKKDTVDITARITHTYLYGDFFQESFADYFYKKGEISSDTNRINIFRIDYNNFYRNKLWLNKDYIDKGYDLYYRIGAKDRHLVPFYYYTEYFRADNTPILNTSDESEKKYIYLLEQNYPNPFNPVTTIKYSIEKQSNVVVKVFDVLGNEITKLIDEPKERGYYSIDFDASRLASGIYYYSISAGEFYSVKKMVLLK
ncbi:MAG: T9SS type A sorting domain-containing protein [Syntrophothermus sp.]